VVFAEREFELNTPVGENGQGTEGAHLRQYLKSKGLADEEDPKDGEDLPSELLYLYVVFLELSAARPSNGFSALPLSFQEIRSWACLQRVHLKPWEVDVLRALDQSWMKVHNGRLSTTRSKNQVS
jgi:hypothetical protein